MREIETFFRQKGISALLYVWRGLSAVTKGSFPKSLLGAGVKVPYIGSDLQVKDKTVDSVTLQINSAREFKILSATDMHLEGECFDLNSKSLKMLFDAIEKQRPNLVIFTGDCVQSNHQLIDAVQLAYMMEKTGVYWCYAFGNHEAREEKEYFKYLIFKGLSYYPHFVGLFGRDELYGYGNYNINILDCDEKLKKSVFVFDPGRDIQPEKREKYGVPADMNGYDFIKPSQIEWYLKKTAALRKLYGGVKTLCYMHIPLPEYNEVFYFDETFPSRPTGRAEILCGEMFESVGCSPFNSGFFEAAKNDGSLQAVFAGHDHINDFIALYEGIYLVYGRCTSYNTYNLDEKFGYPEEKCLRGATLTTLTDGDDIKIQHICKEGSL